MSCVILCQSCFLARRAGDAEDQMLLAEEQPDLIDSLDLQCKGNSNNSHCSRKNSLQEKGDEHSVHESLDYLPSHSNIYKKWLQEQSYRYFT